MLGNLLRDLEREYDAIMKELKSKSTTTFSLAWLDEVVGRKEELDKELQGIPNELGGFTKRSIERYQNQLGTLIEDFQRLKLSNREEALRLKEDVSRTVRGLASMTEALAICHAASVALCVQDDGGVADQNNPYVDLFRSALLEEEKRELRQEITDKMETVMLAIIKENKEIARAELTQPFNSSDKDARQVEQAQSIAGSHHEGEMSYADINYVKNAIPLLVGKLKHIVEHDGDIAIEASKKENLRNRGQQVVDILGNICTEWQLQNNQNYKTLCFFLRPSKDVVKDTKEIAKQLCEMQKKHVQDKSGNIVEFDTKELESLLSRLERQAPAAEKRPSPPPSRAQFEERKGGRSYDGQQDQSPGGGWYNFFTSCCPCPNQKRDNYENLERSTCRRGPQLKKLSLQLFKLQACFVATAFCD